MVQVYVEPIARRHYAPLVSPAGLYRPLCVGASQTRVQNEADTTERRAHPRFSRAVTRVLSPTRSGPSV